MRFKNISRNFSFFKKMLKICKNAKLKEAHESVWQACLGNVNSDGVKKLKD